jgi:hypothetical protein
MRAFGGGLTAVRADVVVRLRAHARLLRGLSAEDVQIGLLPVVVTSEVRGDSFAFLWVVPVAVS